MQNPKDHPVAVAVVSTDPELRLTVKEALSDPAAGARVALEIGVPYATVREPQVQAIRDADPQIVLLDVEDDPELAIRFAQYLGDAHPQRKLIAAGPASLAPELLMQAMSAGVGEYLRKPLTEDAVAAAVQKLRRRISPAGGGEARDPGKMYAVFSAKGGSGCTTVATNLAVSLHRLTGKKTLLLDLELELGEAAVHLGMQPRFSVVDMIRNFHRMDADLLASYIERHESGVHLLSAPLQPERPEAVTADQIRTILHFLRQHYDYLLVDTARSFSPATTAALELADEVLLVATVDLPTLRNIKRSLPLLDRITGRAKEKVKLVVNRHQSGALIELPEVERTLGMEVYRTLANDYEAVSGAINAGTPVSQGAAGAPFARDLAALAAQVAGIPVAANGGRRLGPLGKLFGRKEVAHG